MLYNYVCYTIKLLTYMVCVCYKFECIGYKNIIKTKILCIFFTDKYVFTVKQARGVIIHTL